MLSASTDPGNGDERKQFAVGATEKAPIIDGNLEEEIWKTLNGATEFWQYFPTDSLLAEAQTEIYMCADDENLYVGIKCYSTGNNWIVNSLRRDYRAGGNDNITLIFDSFDDGTNALFFGINPEGAIREGVISNGGQGREDFSESWDNKWRGEAQKYDGYYTAELEIPFSTLRYDPRSRKWGFSTYRFDTQTNEISVWTRTPRNQMLFSLAYTGDMIWEKELQAENKSISIIPFMSSGLSKDYEDGTPSDAFFDFGGDAKFALTPGLNLDLTVNPDFSQVEVDQQITNLDRFEIFFPERRQFFLENADLFGQFGFETINPFFSRRIGVGLDTSTDVTVQNRIYGGLRLSGKIDKKTRVGLLNVQTAANEEQGLPSINYSVAVLQRKIWSRSNIGFIAINKQAFGDDVEGLGLNKFNRVAGLDFNYATQDNRWSGKTFLHGSFTPDLTTAFTHGALLEFNKRKFGATWSHEMVDDEYNAEVGFVRRSNYYRIQPQAELRYYPKGKLINQYQFGIESDVFWRPGFGKTDHTFTLFLDGSLQNSGRFGFNLNHDYVYLFEGFDPTGTDSEELAGDTEYNYFNFTGFYSSDRRKNISWNIQPYIGSYFNGFRSGASGSINFRFQPKSIIQLNYSFNHFDMPYLDETKQNFLIGPRIDYTFSKKIFTTLFLQYNTQSENTNINARFQWRFAPVSDFFLVYTDNYLTGNIEPSDRFAFNIRNRSIVAKVTYWLNT